MADFLDKRTIRALAERLGVRPSKGRGQNFLHDANTVRRIAALAEVAEGDTVLEIGPGLGSLTAGLLHTGAQVWAVEIEPALANQLPLTMRELTGDKVQNLTVVEADALRLSPATLGSDTPARLVANLPYNIAVPVLLHVLATFPAIKAGLVMVQLEVADRLVAPPGSRVYGVPSAKLAWYATARRVGVVPPTVFWPAPKVESGLVALTRTALPEGADRESTFKVIDAAFAQRRKMLRSALSARYGDAALPALIRAHIPPEARGETLAIEDFARLATELTPSG